MFLAHGATHRARKRWIGLTARPRGHYVVDAGARLALESGSKSLLAIGIIEVSGEFEKGDVVGIRDPSGHEFARGLTNYATADARRIRGLHTHEARVALGQTLYDEVVHRDNLVVDQLNVTAWGCRRIRTGSAPRRASACSSAAP